MGIETQPLIKTRAFNLRNQAILIVINQGTAMRNGNKAPRLSFEPTPQAGDGLAINWLQENLVGEKSLGQGNGKLPRWGRTYPDGSRLKLFLDPDRNSLEVGYYSWPPGSHLLSGCGQESFNRFAFAAGVIHEFLPDWYRSGNLIYASEKTRPAHISSSQAYGLFRDHCYFFENFSPIHKLVSGSSLQLEAFINKDHSKEHALTELAKSPPPPLPVTSGDRLINGHQPVDTPRLTDWLRPIMHEHHNRQLPANIRVGYYGPVDGFVNEVDAQEGYDEDRSRSAVAAQIVAEFMPGWEVWGDRLVPVGSKSPASRAPDDGYRVCRWLTREYLTKVEPCVDHSRDLVPHYWANLMFFEMRDLALSGGNGIKYSLPYDIIQRPASVWTRTYPNGAQLRVVYEPDCCSNSNSNKSRRSYNRDHSGNPISRERLDTQDKIVPDLVSWGIITNPPEGRELPILRARPPDEAKDHGSAFFWSN